MTEVPRFRGQPVLIVGMSRCGTSYLASFLSANGVDLGADLVQANHVNPRGFFEERTIVDFHKRVLSATDRLGAQVPLLASSFDHALNSSETEDAHRILESLAGPGLWGWKDPRTLLFLDFWLELLPNAKVIIPIRHPLENYWSYWKRIRVWPVLKPAVFFRVYETQMTRLREAAQRIAPRAYVLDAGTAYRQPALLWNELASFLDLQAPAPVSYPVFHEKEFTRLRLTERTCATFAKRFPGAAGAFQALNEMARLRFEPLPGSSRLDPVWAAMGAAVARIGK